MRAQGASLQASLEREIVRKLLHLPVFVFPLIALYSRTATVVVLALLASAYATTILAERSWGRRVPLMSPIIARCSRASGYDWGPLYLAVGMAVVVMVATHVQAFYAAYVIAVSDTVASLVGMRFGGPVITRAGKTYVGSAVFFATSFVGALLFMSPYEALVTAAVLAVVEVVSIKGLDNLTLPIMAMMLMQLMA